jgi:hypothetical protein
MNNQLVPGDIVTMHGSLFGSTYSLKWYLSKECQLSISKCSSVYVKRGELAIVTSVINDFSVMIVGPRGYGWANVYYLTKRS